MSIQAAFFTDGLWSGCRSIASGGQLGFQGCGLLLAPDGSAMATINNDLGQPLEATTATDGGFTPTIKDGPTIKQLLTLGCALLFKKCDDDLPCSQAEGL